MAINRVIVIGLSFSFPPPSLSLFLCFDHSLLLLFFPLFSTLHIWSVYIYTDIWNVQERVITLHTFAHSFCTDLCVKQNRKEKKKWAKTEWDFSFRLTHNKLFFFSSSHRKKTHYYASVDMQICVQGVVLALAIIKFVRAHAAHMSLNTRLKANAISDKQIREEVWMDGWMIAHVCQSFSQFASHFHFQHDFK